MTGLSSAHSACHCHRGRARRVVAHIDPSEFTFETAVRPTSLAIDPGLRLFRRLDASEIPPILRQATLDPLTVTLLASRDTEFATSARALAAGLMDAEPRFADDGKLAPDASALIIGLNSDVDAVLARLGLPARPPS